MIDPFSILTVLKLTAAIIQYLNDVKGANKEREELLAEVSSASGVLLILKDLAERSGWNETWSTTLESVSQPNGPIDQYKIALERLTSKILPVEGWRKAGRALAWPFQREEIRDILATIERQKSLFNLAIQNDHFGLSQAIKLDVAQIQGGIIKINKKIDILQSDQRAYLEDQANQRILDWLCSLDFSAQQIDLAARRQKGTGEWLLGSDQFATWLNGTKGTLLCPGIPGAGKTMLSSIVIDYLIDSMQSDDIGIAYLYCNYKSQLEQTPTALLESLLKQLASSRKTVSEGIKRTFDHYSSRKTRPTFGEICQLLSNEIKSYARVFIVIDALDECSDNHGARQTLSSQLKTLQDGNGINLLITSRFISNIMQEWNHAAQLEIRARDEDVQKYIEGQIFRLARCVKGNINLQQEIKSSIVQNVDGMFLLAQLHIDSLVDKTSPKAIRKALLKLPRGSDALDTAYGEAMDRIDGQKQGFKDLADQVLSWITTARRPLSVQELQHAIAIELEEAFLDPENISDIEDILSVCGGLVIIDLESNIVRLVHYTTQEYLESIRPERFPFAQQDVCASCITYLCYDTFLDGYCMNNKNFEARIQQNSLLDYAARYWGIHAQNLDQETHNLALTFLTNDAKVSCASQVLLTPSSRHGDYSQLPPKTVSGIHLAAYFGLNIILFSLLTPKTIDVKDSNGRTPLMWAVRGEHESSVRLLLEKGADANTKCRAWNPTALHDAAWCENETIIRLLSQYGADINATDDDHEEDDNKIYEKTLLQALGRTHLKPRLLSETPSESTTEHYDGCAPIHQAAGSNHTKTLLLLLQLGANPETRTKEYGSTALHIVSELGHLTAAKILLSQHANPSARSHEHAQTALHLASARGHEPVVRLLLDHGADPHTACSANGYTALHMAAHNGHEAVVRLLVERGADVAAQTYGEGESALDLAVNMGWERVEAFLEEAERRVMGHG